MMEERTSTEREPELDSVVGGDSACWAHLVCSECGAIEGDVHLPGCPSFSPGPLAA